ncbi:MAG TPA: hypothetical protein VNZ45_17210, partial [Bacteroidia bacterium]|nr:hypothetical protein [Bacteroidia bacterium]
MIQIIDESLTLVIALSIGIYAFRYMNILHRIFFFQLLGYVLIYILTYAVNIIQRANNLTPNNLWVFNLSMPLETGFLTSAVYEYFKNTKLKIWIWIGYLGFL